jgi:hypothetical protein
MNHRCDVDFIPYDKNGWVCGGKVNDGEGYFTFYVPVKYVGKQTDITQVIAQYNTDKGKSEATDKLLAERILEMSHWESDSLRLESLRVFKAYCTTYDVAFDLTDIDFEIFVLEAIGFEEKYELNEAWSFSVNAQELDLSSEKTLQSRNLNFTTTSEWPEELGECGWEFKKEFYAEGISIIDEGPEYGLTMWKLDFSHRNIAAKIAGVSIDYAIDEKAFVQQLGWLISSTDLRQTGQHRYYFHNGDAGFYSIVFESGKPVSWEVDYFC